MKRSIALLALCLTLTACTPSTTPAPQALAPGYANTADQQMGAILSGAHQFYDSIQQQSASGQLILTAEQKAAFNLFGTSLNAAQTVYLAYHGGQATQVQAQTAVNTVQQQQAALPLPGAK